MPLEPQEARRFTANTSLISDIPVGIYRLCLSEFSDGTDFRIDFKIGLTVNIIGKTDGLESVYTSNRGEVPLEGHSLVWATCSRNLPTSC